MCFLFHRCNPLRLEILDNVNPDLSDSEFIERDEPLDHPTPALSDSGEVQTPGYDLGEDDDEGDEEDGEEGEEKDIDEELAAELDLALGDEDEEDGDEDDDDESEDEDEDDEDDEDVQARKLINEEIRDLEAAVAKKGKEITSSSNPLIKVRISSQTVFSGSYSRTKKRFEDALKKLTVDLEMKLAQRDEMKEKQRLKKEGDIPDAHTAGIGNNRDAEVVEIGDDDLFGSPPTEMDLG